MDKEKLKAYEKLAIETYVNAKSITDKIRTGAGEYYKEKLTLALFEKMLPPLWKLEVE